MIPPREQCIRAYQSRDARFDGWFILGVVTTGIYCRPSCPTPVPPKPDNVRFYATAAAAQRVGFRACKRCRPDASPGSPEWNVRADIVGRAMRLIADGAVDRDGVPGLARSLALSERHLNRVLIDEVGAGPLALARAQRAQTARLLIETTALPFGQIALAAGFGSVRQFNDTIREVFAAAPRDLRRARVNGGEPAGGVGLHVRLPFRRPFRADQVFPFIGHRAIAGVEAWDGHTYRRAMRLPGGAGIVALTPADDHVGCALRLEALGDLQAAIQRCRRLLDLDADPVAIDAALAGDPRLRRVVRRRPGLRSPGAVDVTEAVARAVVGQQISVTGARTVLGRIAAAAGTALDAPADGVSHVFPDAAMLADAPDAALPMPVARRRALREVCRMIAGDEMRLDAGSDRERARAQLVAVSGIGPWTAEYVAMRGLSDPDAFPASDLGVRHGLARLGIDEPPARAGERWRPWRAYAVHHLWHALEGA